MKKWVVIVATLLAATSAVAGSKGSSSGKQSHTGYRSSESGQFVSKKAADKSPSTTQKESVPNKGRGDTGRKK